jgi:arylsulfatase A-like enzyme
MRTHGVRAQTVRIFGTPGAFTIAVCAVTMFYFVRFVVHGLEGYTLSPSLVGEFLISLAVVFFIARAVENIPIIALRLAVSCILLVFLCGFNAYQISTGVPVDFSLVSSNIALSFSKEAFTVIGSAFTLRESMIWLVIIAGAALIEIVFRAISRKQNTHIARIPLYIACAFFAVMFSPAPREGLGAFMKGAISPEKLPTVKMDSRYPFLTDTIPHTNIRDSIPSVYAGKPNVFLIMIESFNANFVERKTGSGVEYTPNFNRLIAKGIYVERFYGNSIQTCKGQEAALLSIIPSINGKLFVSYPDLAIEGIPSIFAKHGYRTLFFQAYRDLTFDNTGPYMRKAGFSEVRAFPEFKKKGDESRIWGWGVEDGLFYERFFEYLDGVHEQNPDSPVFATLATVGTHIPCEGMPDDRVRIISTPRNLRERYANALHLSDSQLPVFFDKLAERPYLANSIVIITSDHSFPMREHGMYNNEICFYEESFRVPMLLIWNGALKPERISGRPYSQIDIGPTLFDLIGIRDEKNTMRGISLFDRTTPHPVFLVQPYNGTYLEVVDYPFKYIRHLRDKKEFVFNLADDSSEKMNLAGKDAVRDDRLRTLINMIYANQQLINENRIRPRE